MDNFKVIYQISKYLEGAMDYSEPAYDPISAIALNLSNMGTMAFLMLMLAGTSSELHLRKQNLSHICWR